MGCKCAQEFLVVLLQITYIITSISHIFLVQFELTTEAQRSCTMSLASYYAPLRYNLCLSSPEVVEEFGV